MSAVGAEGWWLSRAEQAPRNREKQHFKLRIISQMELDWFSFCITQLPAMELLQVYFEARRELGLLF